jgi:hypothetical protein
MLTTFPLLRVTTSFTIGLLTNSGRNSPSNTLKLQRDRQAGTLKLTQDAAIIKLYEALKLDKEIRAPICTPMSTTRLLKVDLHGHQGRLRLPPRTWIGTAHQPASTTPAEGAGHR